MREKKKYLHLHPQSRQRSEKKLRIKKGKKTFAKNGKKTVSLPSPTCKGKGNIANQPLQQRQQKKNKNFFQNPCQLKKKL